MRSSSWMLAAVAAVTIVSLAPRAEAAASSSSADVVSAASRYHHGRHHWHRGFSGSRVYAPNNFRPTGSEAYDAQQGLGGKFGGR